MTNYSLLELLRCSTGQAETLTAAYRDEHGWHAQTVIAAAGALVGHAIQTSAYSMAAQGTGAVTEFERPTNPPFGKFVNCSDRIAIFVDNELAFLKSVAEQLNWFTLDAVPEMPSVVSACVEQIGGDWFPRLSVASEDMPREWSPDAVPRLAAAMRAHLDHYSLAHNTCEVLCLSLALGHLVGECKDRLDPAIALRIGLEMAVSTANIGNLDRPHVASLLDDSSSEELECALDDLLPDALNGADCVEPFDGGTVESDFPADVLNGGSAEDEEPTTPRTSRLTRDRPKLTAFGKRQFA